MFRYDAINALIAGRFPKECRYLEIGLERSEMCFDRIKATEKAAVDPDARTRATYCQTSDLFFQTIACRELLEVLNIRWDLIFVDGLHLAEQAHRDIENAILYTTANGLVVVHDCNPPDWKHAHSDLNAYLTHKVPWNGTVWKAFYLFRTQTDFLTYTVDADYGIGVIDKSQRGVPIKHTNKFFDYGEMAKHRREHLGLISVAEFQRIIHERT